MAFCCLSQVFWLSQRRPPLWDPKGRPSCGKGMRMLTRNARWTPPPTGADPSQLRHRSSHRPWKPNCHSPGLAKRSIPCRRCRMPPEPTGFGKRTDRSGKLPSVIRTDGTRVDSACHARPRRPPTIEIWLFKKIGSAAREAVKLDDTCPGSIGELSQWDPSVLLRSKVWSLFGRIGCRLEDLADARWFRWR